MLFNEVDRDFDMEKKFVRYHLNSYTILFLCIYFSDEIIINTKANFCPEDVLNLFCVENNFA